MVLERLEVLKESEKSRVYLVFDGDSRKMMVEKHLQGEHKVYEVLQTIRHPYLPRLYEVRFEQGETVVVEEYIPGGSLAQVQAGEQQLSAWLLELCQVLSVLHDRHILHRDIKPSNLLLGEDGHIRLIDFDAAREVKVETDTDTRLLGTRGYAPPEQYGFAQTDQRADIYAIGITWNSLLGQRAKKPPYRAILQKCTNLNPTRRYPTVKALARAWRQRTLRRILPWLTAGLTLVFVMTAILWYRAHAPEITQRRYPDEALLLYATQGDYIIAQVDALRNSGQSTTMEIDLDGDGQKETIQLSGDPGGAIMAELTSGIPAQDGVYAGVDFLDWMNVDVPLGNYMGDEPGTFPTIPDEDFVQLTCLDLDTYSRNGTEILISVGDGSSHLVTAVYAYRGNLEEPVVYRGCMWGSTVLKQLESGAFSAPLLHNPYAGENLYTYSSDSGISGNTVDYEAYQAAVHGDLSLEQWHDEVASRDQIRDR